MGLSHSKAHPRVTRVAPLQDKGEEASSVGSVDFASNLNLEENSSHSFPRHQDQPKAVEGQLPPLRETWYGRYSAGPRAMHFDTPLEQGETSIIKRHPPRRLQTLESSDLPQVVTAGKLRSQHAARTAHKAKELEKKMQIPSYISGKRQYLHKMQMLEMNRKRQEAQMELKKDCHREAIINKQNPREHKAKKILQSLPRNDDDDLTWVPDESANRNPGNSWNATLLEHQAGDDYCCRKIGKMETWLCEQETRGQLSWEASSSDSDEPGRNEKKPRPLVRTRTEKIPLFDEFFDQE